MQALYVLCHGVDQARRQKLAIGEIDLSTASQRTQVDIIVKSSPAEAKLTVYVRPVETHPSREFGLCEDGFVDSRPREFDLVCEFS
ncbi:hypothetical protein [Streptomyces hygroscopicus]|uniref:hypothetical protein n=1 Tax=Streptomyces hygroscopicus TaxID=1912 RepID=UPI00207BA1B2|nr:hypothetical protein [Streptomyces hygroscopicus]